jgi:hypothetical protein
MSKSKNKINNFKDYLNSRDFTNYDGLGADDEDENGNFINNEDEFGNAVTSEPEKEEIKRVPILGAPGSPFKWPKPLTDDTEYTQSEITGDEKRLLNKLRKRIVGYQNTVERPERDLKERPKKKPTNENIITKFDNFIR